MIKVIQPKSNEFFKALIQQDRVQRYLNTIRKHHGDTYGHSFRVGLLSVDLGYDNECSDEDLTILGYAGLLHDTGKTDVPAEVLSKPMKLSTKEKKIIRSHPRLGFLQLEDFEYDTVRRVVVAHHEYQQNPSPRMSNNRRTITREEDDRRENNERITTLTQIVAISDIYDALISKRAYKDSLPKPEVEIILRQEFTGNHKYIDQVILR
ncbi:MAG: HD domain-containing protein [Nanoarchaeota archaeon]|nr:HD domain-containing protein [Nanoarchaeota archaeon]MBU1854426.1 HD domain-containing protein [Nanoarchaeota archaeon]